MSKLASLVPALNVLIGTLCGIAIASFWQPVTVDSKPAALDPAPGNQGADPNLAAILGELRSISDRLALPRAKLAASPTQPASSREPVVDDGTTSTEVTTLLERCTTLIERLERRTSSPGAERALIPAPRGSARRTLAQLTRLNEEELASFSREHMFWTYQQVLDHFGQPNEIWTEDAAVTWYYEIDDPDENHSWTINFADGMLTAIYTN